MKEESKFSGMVSYGTDDIFTDENDVATSVLITDYVGKNPIQRVYKLHWTKFGAYINFHGERFYILVEEWA